MVYFQKMQTKFFTQFLSLFIIVQLLFAPIGLVFAVGKDSVGETPGFDSSISGYNGGDVNTSPDTGGDTVLGQTVDTGGANTASKLSGVYAGFGALVGCKNADSRALGGTFGSLGSLFAKKAASTAGDSPAAKKATDALGLTSSSISGGSQAVPVLDQKGLTTAEKIQANTAESTKLSTADNIRNNCLNGLAYRIAKYALAKLTQKTVNWINSGFNGDAFFIRDQNSYMRSIQNDQINSILGPIGLYSNRNNYPYGRDFARAYLQHQKNTYNMYAQSNLSHYFNKYMTPAQYSGNFMGGGWNGWLALTQNPANNPLGFGMITSQQIADRTAVATNEATNELNWGDGFLSQKKCVDPINYTPKDAKKNPCNKWETVTPGIAISNQLSNAMGSSYRQLEMADQINESMSVVFDALVNQAMSWGVSQLSTRKDPSFATFGGTGSNKVYDSSGNDITNRSSKQYDSNGIEMFTPQPGGWFDTETSFDITSTQNNTNNLAIVLTTQRLYKQQLQKSIAPLPQIVPKLAELDYCIPGPNPGWENNVENMLNQEDVLYAKGINISDINTKISDGYGVAGGVGEGLMVAGGIVAGVTGVTGVGLIVGGALALTGLIVEQASSWLGDNKQTEVDANQTIVENVRDAETNLQNNLINETKNIDRKNFEDYKTAIHKYYGNNLYEANIPVALKANSMIANIQDYKDNVENTISVYNDAVAETDSNIAQLTAIKKEVDAIVAPYKKNFTYCPEPFDPKTKDGLYTPGNTAGGTTIKDAVLNPVGGGAIKGATSGGATIDKAVKAGAAGSNIQ